MIKILIGLIVIVVLVQIRGKTLASAKAGRGTGESRTYDKPLDVVWEATVEVIKTSTLDLISEELKSFDNFFYYVVARLCRYEDLVSCF